MNNPFEIEEKETNYLLALDEFEEKIKELDKLNKKYKDIKDNLKKQMLNVAKENNLEQVKWTTPKGIKITLSVGQEEIMEERTEKVFNQSLLEEKYPDIYEECLENKKRLVTIKNASNDRLVVTMPKEEKND